MRRIGLAAPALAVLALAGCGGASDAVGASAPASTAASTPGSAGSASPSAHSGVHLDLVAYSVPKAAFDRLIPAFQATDAGRGVDIAASYGASGDQSRKVAAGLPADVVNFSITPDVTRLVKAGLVEPSWSDDAHHGIVADSVVTVMVRKGNPKGIHDWSDLLAPGVEVVTPNPLSSGSAKWNLLAPYAQASSGGTDKSAGLDLVRKLISHTKGQPKSGREATELFEAGTGDALLSYESEAIATESKDPNVEHVTPPTTFAIETPVAVLAKSADPAAAKAFRDFLFTPAAQEIWAQVGYRPVDAGVLAAHTDRFPTPTKLWTIADLGGWDAVDADLFDPTNGPIALAYNGS